MVKIEPNFVTQIKTSEGKDGYNAVQLGMGTKKSTHKPQIGHAKAAGLDSKIRWFRETRLTDLDESRGFENKPINTSEDLKPGQEIKLNQVFSVGDSVKVTGVSKGKGFAGGMKRHGFHGGPKTHGQSDRWRAPGSIGSGTTPGRVYAGKKMAGHMGVDNVSYKGLEVLAVNKEDNVITIKGGIPGAIGGLITVQKMGRIKGYTPPPEEKPSDAESSGPASMGSSEASEPKETEVKVADEVKEEGEK